jgi:hypothetical protein
MSEAVEIATSVVTAVHAAVITRRPVLLQVAGCRTETEAQLVDIIDKLLTKVMDLEDYQRRVDFVMECMTGDLLGQVRKCKSVRQGEPNDGNGFVPVIKDEKDE